MTMIAPVAAKIIRSLSEWKFKAATELTISTGAITATQASHTVDTESDAASDDLDTVNGIAENEFVIMRPANDARTVVFKHGTGNLECVGNSDVTLDDGHDCVLLLGLSSTVSVMSFGGAGIADLVEDTSPELGADLSLNAFGLDDSNGNEMFTFTETVSAVNHLLWKNEATGVNPGATAAGDDTNIGINWIPKGSGTLQSGGVSVMLADASIAGTGLQEFLGLNLTDSTELTIATGAITVTQGFHTVDTESDAASDDLDTITVAGGAGDILFLRAESGARTVVVKHGTGNVNCVGNADISLDDAHDICMLVRYDGSSWSAFNLSDAGSGLANVVDDATPQLGADLDLNSFGIDDTNGNEMFLFTATASAVNELTWKNEATGSDPGATASGGDTNIGIDWIPKGSGTLKQGGVSVLVADATTAGTGLQEFLGVNLTDATELTISSGAVTVTQGYHSIDTEGDASSDDLDTITAAGNILCVNDTDITLDDGHDYAIGIYDGTNWKMASPGVGGGISNVVEDTSPQLGADLDLNAFDLNDTNGNLVLTHTATASAVNGVEIINATTGNGPTLIPAGTDTNVTLQLQGKGSGIVDSLSTMNVANLRLAADASNSTAGDVTMVTSISDHNDMLTLYDGSAAHYLLSFPVAKLTTTDGHIVAYNAADNAFEMVAGGIANIVEDTTPQLGGDLDTQGNDITGLGLLDFATATELTIATGAVTVTQSFHTIDTESDAATDDLDTITASGTAGEVIIIHPANAARTIVLTHGVGNILCAAETEITLSDVHHYALCVYDGTNWMAHSGSQPASPGWYQLTDGATITIDGRNGNRQWVELGGNRTIEWENLKNGQNILLRIRQDSTGSRTITSWTDATLNWSGATAPTLTTTGDQSDLLGFCVLDDTDSMEVMLGVEVSLDYADT